MKLAINAVLTVCKPTDDNVCPEDDALDDIHDALNGLEESSFYIESNSFSILDITDDDEKQHHIQLAMEAVGIPVDTANYLSKQALSHTQ